MNAAVAISCGLLLALSSTNFDLWPLAWIAWAPVIAVTLDPRDRGAAVYGFLCGFAANAGSCYWLIPYLQRFANLSRTPAILIFLLVVSYQAIAWALFCFLLRHLHNRARVPVTFLAPVLFVAIEFAMPNIFGATLAITQAWALPAIQIAEITGPLGVSFLLMLGNAALYDAARAWRIGTRLPVRSLTGAIGVLAACLLFGVVRIQQVQAAREAAPKLTVGVVQANVGSSSKGPLEDAHQRLFAHQQASTRLELAGANLIVWPELAYPYEFRRDQKQDRLLGDLRRVRAGVRTPVIFGAVTVDADSLRRYNSVLLFDQTDDVRGRYDKNIPLIVGAHIPFYPRLPFIRRLVPDANHFERGTDVVLLSIETKVGTVNIAPTIGFEDTQRSFGRRLARLGPNLIVNLSNDVWFGNTSEPWQHLALSIFRTVEMRLDLVRASNTGISAFVDSTGRVYAKTSAVESTSASSTDVDTLLQRVAIQQAQTVYARFGEWLGIGCLIVSAVLVLRTFRSGRRPEFLLP